MPDTRELEIYDPEPFDECTGPMPDAPEPPEWPKVYATGEREPTVDCGRVIEWETPPGTDPDQEPARSASWVALVASIVVIGIIFAAGWWARGVLQ